MASTSPLKTLAPSHSFVPTPNSKGDRHVTLSPHPKGLTILKTTICYLEGI
ncbi:hypothetical protein RESH_06320 [Rhodopirellula europaea SH398]|uniref:Uncharacterized protein n=1 Tax=Rhodopirellula europaea SH398 TaxID=1263868 RepID=M5RUV9_9BACT|nr:hypothetical protein RESH_06320 [Rhodopirellula europaea SH398]